MNVFVSNISINYEASNYYKDNKTCLLFTNSLIHIQFTSIFIFKSSESLQTIAEGRQVER